MTDLDTANTFTFERVLFFGRTLKEYEEMFNFSANDLKGFKILDCPSGPASFVAQANKYNVDAIGVDPLYENTFASLKEIVSRDLNDCCDLQVQVKDLAKNKRNMEIYRKEKDKAINFFLDDFDLGFQNKRYLPYRLPHLPFNDNEFDMVLSSNFLILYSDYKFGGMMTNSPFDLDFHIKAVIELLRVSKSKLMIYPIRGPYTDNHEFLPAVLENLKNVEVNYFKTNYVDLFGCDQVLQITKHI